MDTSSHSEANCAAALSPAETPMPAAAATTAEKGRNEQQREVITVGVLALQGAFSNHIAAFRRLELGRSLHVKQVRLPAELQHVDALVIPGGESTCMRIIGGETMIQALRNFALQQRKPVWGTCAGCILLAESVLTTAPPSACDEAAEQHDAAAAHGSSRGNRKPQQDGPAGCLKAKEGVEQQETAEAAAAAGKNQEARGGEVQHQWQSVSSSRTLQESADGYGNFVGGARIQVCRNFFGRQVNSFEAPLRCAGRLQGVADGMVAVCIRAPAILKVLSPKVEVLAYIDHPDAAAKSGGLIAAVAQDNLLLTTFHPELTEDIRLHDFFLKHFVYPSLLPTTRPSPPLAVPCS